MAPRGTLGARPSSKGKRGREKPLPAKKGKLRTKKAKPEGKVTGIMKESASKGCILQGIGPEKKTIPEGRCLHPSLPFFALSLLKATWSLTKGEERKEAVLSQKREAGAPTAEKRTNPQKKAEGTTGASCTLLTVHLGLQRGEVQLCRD